MPKRKKKEKTHKERFIELLEDFGIHDHRGGRTDTPNGITLEANCHEKVRGYSGFFCVFDFNEDGRFYDITIGE